MKKNDINIIVDQNVSDTSKKERGTGYLLTLLAKQRKTEENAAYLDELSKKKLLSVEEAADLFGIGRTKIRELSSDDNCPFVLCIGGHRKIKREEFEKYIMEQFSV